MLSWKLVLVVTVLCAAVFTGGCGSTAPAPATSSRAPHRENTPDQAPVAPISNLDACAMRLHDICEPLLLYYLREHHLPGRLEDLKKLPGFADLELTCPVSHKAYLYNPIGITTAESRERIIAYDAAPSHSGMRWAISIIEPEDNGPLVTKVIALPEAHFSFMGKY